VPYRCDRSLLLFHPKAMATSSGPIRMTCVCVRRGYEVAPGSRQT
jgi:hypothetical protein